MKYGNTSVGKMGCVPVATFNALYYFGAMKCLSDVILAFETVKAADATRGTNRYLVPYALKMLGLNCKRINDKRKAMNALKKHHSMILVYALFEGGGHAVFIDASHKKKLYVWNEYTNDNKKTTYDYKKIRENKFVSNMLTF